MSKRRGRQPTPKAPKSSLTDEERGAAPTAVVDVEPIEVEMPQIVQVEMEPAPAPTDEWHVFSVPAGVPVQVVQSLTQDVSGLEIILPTGQVVTQIGSDDPFDALADSLPDLDPETEQAMVGAIAALPDLPLPEGADERLVAAFDNASLTQPIEEMKEEYDFSDGEQGKFYSEDLAKQIEDNTIWIAKPQEPESSPDTATTVELDQNTPMPTQAELLDYAIAEAMSLRSLLDEALAKGEQQFNGLMQQFNEQTRQLDEQQRLIEESIRVGKEEQALLVERQQQLDEKSATLAAYEVRVADLDALTTSQVFEISDLRTERDTLKQRIERLLTRMKDAKLYRLFTVTGKPAVVYATALSISDVIRLALDAKIIEREDEVANVVLQKTDYLLG